MSDKRWRAKIARGLVVLLAIIIAIIVYYALAIEQAVNPNRPDWIPKPPFVRSEDTTRKGAADDSTLLVNSEVEKTARAWAANNINGVAGDEIVNLIMRETNTEQPDMLREYLTERVESFTNWSYGPIATAGENVYELTATASTLLHEMTPPPIFESAGGVKIPTPDPADFRSVATAPFRLTVDADTMSVTDWRLRADGAGVSTSFVSQKNEAIAYEGPATIRRLYDEKTADCINAVMAENPTEQDATTLFIPPNQRKEADAARLRAVVNSAGLGEVCADWIGE